MKNHPIGPAALVAAVVWSTSGCAQHQEIMARPGESKLTAAAIPAPPAALVIAPEVRSRCHLNATEGTAQAQKLPFDTSLLTSGELGTLAQLSACFATGPMAGRTLTLRGRADPRGWRDDTRSLGDRRADAVQTALVSFGLPKASVRSASRGATDAAGKDEPGWETDRSVDIAVDAVP